MTVCIFHANCADGFGAAWVVRKALGEIDFHPGAVPGEPPPDVTGKDVVMVISATPGASGNGREGEQHLDSTTTRRQLRTWLIRRRT